MSNEWVRKQQELLHAKIWSEYQERVSGEWWDGLDVGSWSRWARGTWVSGDAAGLQREPVCPAEAEGQGA